jgi:Ca-activated chloride channel family protein
VALACCAVSPAGAQSAPASGESAERTLSPYFFVLGGDPSTDRLPLESTEVEYAIVGSIAEVAVRQVYENRGGRPIHARYVFPASTRAAVHGMAMQLGRRRIVAEIRERERARREFEQARSEGRTASLLEQQRPNVFSLDVSNILPGDRVEVTLEYTELLTPTDRVYEFVFPTVVGPRYASASEAEAARDEDAFVASPYLPEGEPSPVACAIAGTLSAGIPIREVESPSHAIEVVREDRGFARVSLDPTGAGCDRDHVLRYRLAGEGVQSGLALYQEGGEKFFALVVEPPSRIAPQAIPPREYVFVLDVSGSMHGFPLDTAKALMRDLVLGLRPEDRFNLLLFSGGSSLLSDRSLPASAENLHRAMQTLERQAGGGGTELLAALERALSLSDDAGLSRHFVVVTDGYVSADHRAYELVAASRGRANVHAFGIGSSVNRHLIEGLARAGMGEPFVVLSADEVPDVSRRFFEYVSTPVLADVELRAHGFEIHDVEPAAIPDVLAERPIVIHGRYTGEPTGELVLTGLTGDGPFVQTFAPATLAPRPENQAIRYLWARARIAALSDFAGSEPGEEIRRRIVELGLAYNLLTRFTSFVAIAHEIRNPGGDGAQVDQPLVLPAGVSSLAVGRVNAPEPELLLLATGALLVLAAWGRGSARARPALA